MRFIVRQLPLLLCLIIALSQEISAAHLVGGDGTYTFVRFNSDSSRVTFLVRFNLYKDSNNGAQLRDTEDFGVYREVAPGEWVAIDDIVADRIELVEIPAIDEPCREEPPSNEVGVQTGSYEFLVTLDVGDSNYMIAYLRCCRNDFITNMFAFEKGAVFDLIIAPEAQRTGNNSPTFNEFPPIFICSDFPLKNVTLECTDPEGDELRYSFCTPIAVGGPDFGGDCETGATPDEFSCPPPYEVLLYRPPFSDNAPMGGNPEIKINPNTGLMTGTPEAVGQYVIGVCVEEYRNGILLSRLRRDFQFNAITCVKEISANLEADEVIIDNSTGTSRPVSILKACGDSLVDFRGIDANNTIISYEWQIYDPDGDLVIDTIGRNVRNLQVYFPELGEYIGTLAVEDSQGCRDTSIVTVLRLPDMEATWDFEILDDCYLGSVQFNDLSIAEQSEIIEWDWDFAGEASSNEKDPIFEFSSRGVKRVTLISRDLNTCIDTFVEFVDYNPPHDRLLISSPEITLCYGDSIFFDNMWIKEGGDYEEIIQYSETGCDSIHRFLTLDYHPQPTETYIDTILCPGETVDYFGVNYNLSQIESTGLNDFEHSTISVLTDCDSILHYIKYEYEILPTINISEDFVYVVANKDYKIPISINGDYDQTIWTPNTGLDCYDCLTPIANSEIDTAYTITVLTDDYCQVVDSIFLDFVVVPERYFIPTIMSSGATLEDDRNFYLMTQENAYETVSYSLKVYDRWGGLLFDETDLKINDRNQGWSARSVKPGSYPYQMEIKEFFETKVLVGTVTIVE